MNVIRKIILKVCLRCVAALTALTSEITSLEIFCVVPLLWA